MLQDKDAETLLDIARAARLIVEFKGNLSKDAFIEGNCLPPIGRR